MTTQVLSVLQQAPVTQMDGSQAVPAPCQVLGDLHRARLVSVHDWPEAQQAPGMQGVGLQEGTV